MMGHRAIYADGWKAVTRHIPGVAFEDDDWELYHLAEDRSECNNLAGERPELLAELVERWWQEAEEYGVLPLDDRTIELFMTRYRDRSPHPADRRYHYFPPMSPMPGQVAPALGGRGWDLAASIDRPDGAGRRALRHRHREQRRQRLRRRRAPPPRLQLLRRPPPRHLHASGACRRVRQSASASDGSGGAGTPPW